MRVCLPRCCCYDVVVAAFDNDDDHHVAFDDGDDDGGGGVVVLLKPCCCYGIDVVVLAIGVVACESMLRSVFKRNVLGNVLRSRLQVHQQATLLLSCA